MSGVKVFTNGPVLTIQLDNPPVNAISAQVLDGLETALLEARTDPAVRGVLITGSDQIFAAGADIPSFLSQGLTPQQAIRRGVEVFAAVESFPKPVVAAILGHCLGGGLELALAADLRVGDPDVRLGQPEVRLGIIPGWNGTMRLPRLIGQSRAAEIILTGSPIDGSRAYAIGLLNRLAPANEVWATADNLLREVIANSPAAIAEAKALLRRSFEPDAGEREQEAVARLMADADAAEGVTAFLERRRPRF
jgi:enoyl-CoA hydratase/carnithine racemase